MGYFTKMLRKDPFQIRQKGLHVAVEVVNAPAITFHDFYFMLLEGSWLKVLSVMCAIYMIAIFLFAAVYASGGNATFDNALEFSLEQADLAPESQWRPSSWWLIRLVTVFQRFLLKYCGGAMLTGIVFARFARPVALLTLSDTIIIHPPICSNETQGLVTAGEIFTRVVLQRVQMLHSATIQMEALIYDREHSFIQSHSLSLVSPSYIMLFGPKVIRHVIDESSPLFNIQPTDLMQVYVSVSAEDPVVGQRLSHTYCYANRDRNILWDSGAEFKDLMGVGRELMGRRRASSIPPSDQKYTIDYASIDTVIRRTSANNPADGAPIGAASAGAGMHNRTQAVALADQGRESSKAVF
jgi:hypothetical protein